LTLIAVSTGYAATSDALNHRIGIERDGWTASASASSGQVANAIDGDEDTLWMASFDTEDYFSVDLGQIHTVNRLEWLTGNNKNDFPAAFRVDVSLDGETWNTVADSNTAEHV